MIQPIGARGIITPGMGFIHPYAIQRISQHETLGNDLNFFWCMEEASGDTITDEVENWNGTLAGTTKPTRVTGKIGNGIQFSDTTSTLNRIETSILSSSDWRSANGYAFAFWFNPNWSTSGTGYDRVITKAGSSSASVTDFTIQQDGTNSKLAFYQASSTTHYGVVSGSLTNGTWYLVIAQWDGTKIELFINNESQGTSDVNSINNNSTRKLLVGAIFDGTSTTNIQSITLLNGKVDEIGNWKRALTSDERAFIYNGGAGRFY
jgi:hypothetical protein